MTLERAGPANRRIDRSTRGGDWREGGEGDIAYKKVFHGNNGTTHKCPRYVLVVVRHGVPLEENQSGLSTRGMGKGIGCVRSTRLDIFEKSK